MRFGVSTMCVLKVNRSQRLLFVNCGVYFNPRLYIQHSVPHYNVVVCRPLVVVVGRGGGEEVRV